MRAAVAALLLLLATLTRAEITVRMMAGIGYGIPPKESTATTAIIRRAVFEEFRRQNPDVRVVNAGGLIQVADELHGFDFERARARAGLIFETTREVFALAASDGVPPAVAADRIAEQRMAEPEDRGIWLP